MVKINGEEKNIDGQSISMYLSANSRDISRVAVELNGKIVPKCEYEATILSDGDSVEVVSFVGGG